MQRGTTCRDTGNQRTMEPIEEASTLVTLLNRHREEIAGVWAEMVRRLPDSHYSERPLDELRESTLRAVEAIIEALATHSYTALETYLTDVSLTRLQMGFDIAEVIEALLLCKEAALPIILESCSPRSPEAREAIVQLDSSLRHMIGCFGSLYARAMNRSLEEQRQHIAQILIESQSLGRVTAALLEEIDLVEVLDIVCTEAQALTGATGSTIFLLDTEHDGWLRVARSTGMAPPDLERIPIEKSLTGIALREGQPIVCNDTASEAQSYRGSGETEPTSLLAIPLRVKGVIIGTLDMVDKPGGFTQDDIRIISPYADQAAIAIENARLLQKEQESQRELQMLLDVAAAANSSLDLDETLKTTLDLLVNLIDASRVGVMLRNETSDKLEAHMLRPEQAVSPEDLSQIMQVCEAVVASGEHLYVMPDAERGFVDPGALLPLRVRDRILGVLVIKGSKESTFSEGYLALFESIADQLGVAIENARLHEQAEQAGIAAERNRLARDLHDAVTQTLFSASLIAEVLPRIWERDPQEAQRRLKELRELTRGALAEMRTLLLELRPAALVEARLTDLLHQIAESITGRARVPVTVEVEGECDLPVEVKVALYRIAHEALNNVVKHAGASQASVSLFCGPERVELCISDDGRGFDPEDVPPESLGLGIMRERVKAIGAEIDIDSKVDHGTQVVVVWGTNGVEELL